jgi:hypothetical protein
MTTWSAPRTWSNETMTSTLLNTHVRDNLLHLKENLPPGLAGSADITGVGGAGTSEEYGTTTTGLTWAPSNPTTVDSNTTILNHLYIANQADTTERIGTKSWAPAGAFDARAKIILGSDASAGALTASFALHIGDSGNTNRLMMLLQYAFNTGAVLAQAYTYASSTYTQRGSSISTPPGVPIYVRITRDGSNNNSFYWSANGLIWNFVVTQALTLTVANIGFRLTGNATATFKAAADWLRTSV